MQVNARGAYRVQFLFPDNRKRHLEDEAANKIPYVGKMVHGLRVLAGEDPDEFSGNLGVRSNQLARFERGSHQLSLQAAVRLDAYLRSSTMLREARRPFLDCFTLSHFGFDRSQSHPKAWDKPHRFLEGIQLRFEAGEARAALSDVLPFTFHLLTHVDEWSALHVRALHFASHGYLTLGKPNLASRIARESKFIAEKAGDVPGEFWAQQRVQLSRRFTHPAEALDVAVAMKEIRDRTMLRLWHKDYSVTEEGRSPESQRSIVSLLHTALRDCVAAVVDHHFYAGQTGAPQPRSKRLADDAARDMKQLADQLAALEGFEKNPRFYRAEHVLLSKAFVLDRGQARDEAALVRMEREEEREGFLNTDLSRYRTIAMARTVLGDTDKAALAIERGRELSTANGLALATFNFDRIGHAAGLNPMPPPLTE